MKKHFIFSMISLLLLSLACSTLPFPPTATPSPASASGCVSMEPTQQDIDRALTFTGPIFSPSTWERSYMITPRRVAVTWINNEQGAVAYAEALIFECGYGESDIDNYFSSENWKIIFQNYESYTPIVNCKDANGLRLYQFDARKHNSDYAINFWVKKDAKYRVITTMLVYPKQSTAEMDTYSSRLYPSQAKCSP